MPDPSTPPSPRRRPAGPDVSRSWVVRSAPLRVSLLGVVLVVMGLTLDGFTTLVWVGLAAVVVGVVGTVLLRRQGG
ncbi:hypothetical protein GCM10027047_38530 [Rhodococcus aerolatus]